MQRAFNAATLRVARQAEKLKTEQKLAFGKLQIVLNCRVRAAFGFC